MFRAELLLADVLNTWLGMDLWDKKWLLEWFDGEKIGQEEANNFLKALATRSMRCHRAQFVDRLRLTMESLCESPVQPPSKVLFSLLSLAKGLQAQSLKPPLIRLREVGKIQKEWNGQDLFLLYEEALRACTRPLPMASAGVSRSSSRRSLA